MYYSRFVLQISFSNVAVELLSPITPINRIEASLITPIGPIE